MRSSGQLNRIAETMKQETAAAHASESALSPDDAKARPSEGPSDSIVSPGLYIAGLCVTLSGLYSVNYNLEDTSFAYKTYGIAAAGYLISYIVRKKRITMGALRLPLLAVLALALFAWLPFGHPPGEITGQVDFEDRSRSLQLLFVAVSLLHAFTLTTDASVLFACVPCMTMIALVSTTNSGSEIQNAFLFFIGAATFLMVHENFLRTRSVSAADRKGTGRFRLLGPQLQIAAVCFFCALALANVVAIPIRSLGQALPSAILPQNGANSRPNRSVRSLLSNDSQSIDIATGPVAESDQPVMRVRSSRRSNWRGTTYDYYTGASFENRVTESQRLLDDNTVKQSNAATKMQPWRAVTTRAQEMTSYTLPRSLSEIPIREMQGAEVVTEHVTMLADGLTQIYGAGDPLLLKIPYQQRIFFVPPGGLFSTIPLPARLEYDLRSVVATDDRNRLRRASADSNGYPRILRDRYLQRASRHFAESDKLRALAKNITAGLTNNYDRAAAIRDYIASHCKYNLQASAAPADADRVEHFLTVSHEGYCDSFAASMALLCRYVDIPARVAAGYLCGDLESDGTYLVRQKDKHAWAEVFFPKFGWVAFDATDGSEDISNHNLSTLSGRTTFVKWLAAHGWLPPLLLGCLVVLLLYVAVSELAPRFRSRRTTEAGTAAFSEQNAEIGRAYQAACRLLARRGLPRAPYITPEEYAGTAGALLQPAVPEAEEALRNLTGLHDRFRYGQEIAEAGDVEIARHYVRVLEQNLKRLPGRIALASAPGPT